MSRAAHRRNGAGFGRRGGGRLPGGMRPSLNLASGGTFTRSTEGSYLTGAPTDGSSAFLAWAGVNVRRIENRGDGLGAMLLMEGSRTNRVLRSRDLLTVAAWLAGTFGTASRTADQAPGPDGTTVADLLNLGANSWGYPQALGLGSAARSFTWYVRSPSGADRWQCNTNSGIRMAGATTTTWARREYTATQTNTNIYPGDSSSGDTTALNALLDLCQLEDGLFPTSPIRTLGAAVTRGADLLSFGTYPAAFLTGGFVVQVALDCTSAELIAAAADMRIVQVGANDYLRIRVNAGACVVDLVCGGSVVATKTITLTSRGIRLTLTAKPSAGSLTVLGATTGDGTNTGAGAAWAASTLYVGTDNAGTSNLFGRVGISIAVAA